MSSTSDPQYITLREWATRRYGELPHPNTISRWVKNGMIVPAPHKRGRDWMVTPNARFITEPVPGRSLADRLKQQHGLSPA